MVRTWKTLVGVVAVLLGIAACSSGGATDSGGSRGPVTQPPLPSDTTSAAVPTTDATSTTTNPLAAPGAPDSPATSQEVWLTQVCTSLMPAARFDGRLPNVDPADIAGSRDRVVAYLVARGQALQTAYDGISQAGYPPAPGGEQAATTARTAIQNRIGAVQSTAEQLRTAPTNPAALAAAAGSLRTLAGQLSGPAATFADLGVPQSLQDAARTVPACQSIGVS